MHLEKKNYRLFTILMTRYIKSSLTNCTVSVWIGFPQNVATSSVDDITHSDR
jgi:hypothetical protein